MKRILFVHNNPARFVEIDRDLLAERYDVTEFYEANLRNLHLLQIHRAVEAHDLVFCWFASWHCLAPVLLARRMGKPVVVVVGGYDTANVPEAGYGSQRGGLPKLISRAVMRHATHLITNSQAAKREAVCNAGAKANKISVMYHGVEPLSIGPLEGREHLVLTVGKVWRENLMRKGLLPFVQAASYLPDVKFIHVGGCYDDSINDLRKAASPNVEFLGFLPDRELAALYARASIYIQASLHEGFGMSVAEAMLCGCIPIVTKVGSLPEVVGDTGIYLDSNKPEEIAKQVLKLLCRESNSKVSGCCDNVMLRQQARDRILQHFPLQARSKALSNIVECALGNGQSLSMDTHRKYEHKPFSQNA